jgi:hypothetical protein
MPPPILVQWQTDSSNLLISWEDDAKHMFVASFASKTDEQGTFTLQINRLVRQGSREMNNKHPHACRQDHPHPPPRHFTSEASPASYCHDPSGQSDNEDGYHFRSFGGLLDARK